MSWITVPVSPEEVTSERLFKMARRHRLIPDNVVDAVDYYNGISGSCAMIDIRTEDDDELVGVIIVSEIVDGESAMVDLIPQPQFFTADQPFADEMRESIGPMFEKLIDGRNLRRLTAMVPKTRSRTFKALRASGFQKEGVMRKAIKFQGSKPEDVVIMGMMASKE